MKIFTLFAAIYFALIFSISQTYAYTCDCVYASGTPTCNGTLCIPNGVTLTIPASTTLNLSSTITTLVIENGGSITFGNSAKLNLASGTELIIVNTSNPDQVFPGNNSQNDQIWIGGSPYAGGQNGNGGGVCFSLNQVVAAGGTLRPTASLSSIIGTTMANPGCSSGIPLTAGLAGAYDQIVSVTWSSPGATFTPNGTNSLNTSGAFTGTSPALVTCSILVDVVPAGCNQVVNNVTVEASVLVYFVTPPTALPTNLGSIEVAAGTLVTVPSGLVVMPTDSFVWSDNSPNSNVTPTTGDLTPNYQTVNADKGNTIILTATAKNAPCSPVTATYTILVRTKLPIDLLSFSGLSESCTNKLSWQVANAKNFKHFEVQTSKNAVDFKTLVTISSTPLNGFSGANNLNHNYTFNDPNISRGNNYYRLKMVDQDESIAFSKTVLIKSTCIDPSAMIYPNPVYSTKNVQVQIANFGNIIQGQVIELTGRTIKIARLTNGDNALNVTSLPPGVYWLRISDENKQEKTLKLAVTW